MAEEISKGRIVISKQETKTPILVEHANWIQVPIYGSDALGRLFISKHGIMVDTWMSFTPDTIVAIDPPYYVYSKLPCIIPAMEI